jgi:hypothetical protein
MKNAKRAKSIATLVFASLLVFTTLSNSNVARAASASGMLPLCIEQSYFDKFLGMLFGTSVDACVPNVQSNNGNRGNNGGGSTRQDRTMDINGGGVSQQDRYNP